SIDSTGVTIEREAVPTLVTSINSTGDRVRELAALGWNDSEIARELGISYQRAYDESRRPARNYEPSDYGR
ncbi:MAG: hypothetical protein OXC01_10770, partial [Immundisolibacterales bacterium]|nr:hypothetical protein [Immundisolibacterales bacterium]